MSTGSTIIELVNVSVRVDGATILENVSWNIERGENWAVLGPNGSGKTTLLRVATGYLWPSSGVLRRLGRERIDVGTFRLSVGWITSDLVGQIPPTERVADTVVSGRFAQIGFKNLAWFQPTRDDRLAASQHLELLGCGQLENRTFQTLSQGEKQKVLIARARMAEPLLLILDEPCAGMDPGARQRMLESLEALGNDPEAPTIVLVTHHVEEIMPTFGSTVVLDGGTIVDQGATRDVVTPTTLSNVYGAQVERIVESHGRMWPIWK